MSKQPRDDGNAAIPVLSYKLHGGQTISFGPAAARSAAFGGSTRVVSLYSTDNCLFEIGDDSVDANASNSHLLPAGIYIDVSLGAEIISTQNSKYISVIGINDSEGTLYISERI
jgi:hypothetical protein